MSMAGPAPNYDMQKILSCKSPKEAALMSGSDVYKRQVICCLLLFVGTVLPNLQMETAGAHSRLYLWVGTVSYTHLRHYHSSE